MSDRFHPISMEQLTQWVFTELERRDSLFNIPRRAFFAPRPDHRYRLLEHGVELDTPFGVAAGPHTQLAQNIVAAWLVGARVIELKTVQTLDEIEVHKPCIDVEDEGYNVEWSQELRVHQSFDEYLRAWVLIHALHRRFGWQGERPGVLFNMSVGYDYQGIQQPNVQWYLDAMADASAWLPGYIDIVARYEPAVREIEIPSRLSDTMTLSTMHGCPPGEIEQISRYLIEERHLQTSVKCNPTLLGAERVRRIVNDDLGYVDVRIPDEAFGHDLAWADAVPMFHRLREAAAAQGLAFGLKLSNTLEVENGRRTFDRDDTMYLSGRALHAVTTNLAWAVAEEFSGELPLSFAGGADAFNVAELLGSGVRTATVASDLLKTGGYLRLLQYMEHVDAAFDAVGARDTTDFIRRTATANGFAGDVTDAAACARFNLGRYAESVRADWRYQKASFRTDRSKTSRPLGLFDCIEAPCVDMCAIDQQVPRYMDAVAGGDVAEAVRIVREDNPLPVVLGRVCDHLCENTCVRTHLDQPLAIRQIKRFIMDREATSSDPETRSRAGEGHRVAIVGAGPAGLAAAEALARLGVAVTIFEARPYAGGMVGSAIPAYRLPEARLEQDLARVERLGVEIRYSMHAGTDVTIDGLKSDGYEAVFVAIGAQVGRRLGLPGEDAAGILDGISFLRNVREGNPPTVGRRVGVIGAGDTAMDCARTAVRLGASTTSLIYRRTIDQMPADREEIHAVREEGIQIVERARPVALRVEDGRLAALVCVRTEYHGERDASGRKVPLDVGGSEFEIELDTLVLAVSQHAALDCFGESLPEVTPGGYLAIDPDTLETSIPGVYAGGDVSAHGPASIVRAAADGKRAAHAIAARFGIDERDHEHEESPVDVQELQLRRGRRQYRVPVASTPPERRSGFEETVLGYSPAEAAAEAARCLRCDQLCSLCVSVCPNMALLTYEARPMRAALPALTLVGDRLVPTGGAPYAVDQRYQIALLADLCNECGTCVTACPTAGAPYRDKPRLYLDREEFAAEESNAFLLVPGAAIEGRFAGATHRLEVGNAISYTAPGLRAILDAETFELLEATPMGAVEGIAYSLEPAATMATLLAGLAGSAPHLPKVSETPGSFVPDPRPS